MKRLLSVMLIVALGAACLLAEGQAGKLAGTWQMSMDTPHGAVQGPLELKQEGAQLTGTYAVEGMGSFSLKGSVDGEKVSLALEIPGADKPFGFTGKIDGNKMSGSTEMGGTWSATRK